MTLGLIQLGLGGWGRSWVEEVTRQTPGIATLAWVDPDPGTRATAIGALGLPAERVFGSLAAAMAEVTADAALVVVPLAAHAAATREALEAGLDVLVEKPFTETLAEAATLVALGPLARSASSWSARTIAGSRRHGGRASWCATGAIGRPMACYLDFHFYYGPDYRYFFLEEPLLSDMAIHHFDALRFVLGDEPVEVACQSWSEPESPFKGRPAAIVAIRMARGTVVSYRGSWISRGPTTPYGGVWRLDGTRGAIEMRYRGAGDARETFGPAAPLWQRRGAGRGGPAGHAAAGPQGLARCVRPLVRRCRAAGWAEHRRRQSAQPGTDVRSHPLGGYRAGRRSRWPICWRRCGHDRRPCASRSGTSSGTSARTPPWRPSIPMASMLRWPGRCARPAMRCTRRPWTSRSTAWAATCWPRTDVLLWWGHKAHAEVQDAVVDRVVARVLGGMGLVALHSAHFSKPFKRLMGTSCDLKWRVADEREHLWVVAPGHPIVAGLPERIDLAREEMYGEHFDIPAPDELVLVSWFQGGEVFRSGCCFRRGCGRIFYFRPGHETYPTYHQPQIQQLIGNAVRWATPVASAVPLRGNAPPIEPIP